METNVTLRAARFIRMMTRMHAGPAGSGIRVQVRAGGCSGLDSSFDLETEPAPGDVVIELDGARLFLPESSAALLRGYTIDYIESRMEGGLRFIPMGVATTFTCGSGVVAHVAKVIRMRSTAAAARRVSS